MTTDVEALITGLPFDQTAVSGITMSYSYNTIPVASLTLAAPYIEEVASSFLEDPDQFKQSTRDSPVDINLNCKTGTISFSGAFDGLSFSQSPGGFNHSAIIKSKFQAMHEVYPKFPGIDPTSVLPFKRSPTTEWQDDSEETNKLFRSPLEEVNPNDKTIVEFFIELIRAAILAQQQSQSISAVDTDLCPLFKLLQDEAYVKSIDKALELLDKVDISYVKDTDVSGATGMDYLINLVINAHDTLWDTLEQGLQSLGCIMLPAKDTLYVIPAANFLKMNGTYEPADKEIATTPNHAYPGDYSNFSINDVPYRNLRACFVVPKISDPSTTMWSYETQNLGIYPADGDTGGVKDDGSTGILIVNAPDYLMRNMNGLYAKNSDVQKEIQGESTSWAGPKVDTPEKFQEQMKKQVEEFKEEQGTFKEALDKYAKLRFMQEKYQERGGTITMQFKPSWVPGTTGFLFSRHPNLFYHFYVTNVTHTVSMSGGSVGTAITSVSFISCRYAGSGDAVNGSDEADLFNYDPAKMEELQNAWLSDVGGTVIDDTVD